MYLVKVEVRDSQIEGKGVFTLETVKEGTVVWRFDHTHDQTLSAAEFDKLDDDSKRKLQRVAYLSPSSHRWVFPPDDDPARFTNHSKANNLSVLYDETKSEEPIFVANRNIAAGEELTVNYTEFDTQPGKVNDWE